MLSSPTVTLRPVDVSDIDTIVAWENDTMAWEASMTMAPYSRRIIEEYVERYSADIYAERQLRLMICSSGKTAGMVDMYDFDPANARAMVGIYICPDARRTGVATEALRLMAQYAADRIGLHQLAATVAADNTASQRLFKSAGYEHTATLRQWYARPATSEYTDALVYQLSLR